MTVAIPEPEPTREVTRADTDSWIPVASDVIRLANLIAPTEFVPRSLRDSAPATAAAILYGREVGLPPMTALTQTHVIEGKPAMSAEAMRALVMASGHELEVVDTTRGRCELRGRRHGREKWTTVAVTIDEFRHLTSNPKKPNWQLYPRQMLQARATAELCRLVFPDVIHGFRAIEEFDDTDETGPAEDEAPRSSTVRRAGKKAAAKKSAPSPLEARPERTDTGPPLPGEDGYTDPSAGEASTAVANHPPTGGGGESPAEAQTTDTEHEPVSEGPESPGEGEGEAPEPGDSRPPAPGPRLMSRAQSRGIFAALKQLEVDDDDEERHLIVSTILGRRVESFRDLTVDDAKTLLDTFARVQNKEQLSTLLDEFDTPS